MIDAKKKEKGVIHDTELTADDLKDLVAQFKAFYHKQKGEPISQRTSHSASGSHQSCISLLG